jgi:ferredoxin
MVSFRIDHERWKCIACGACAAVNPDSWQMSAEDGFADLKDAPRKDVPQGILERLDVDEAAFEKNKVAGEACPVTCIHIIKIDSQSECTSHAACTREHKE